MGLSIVHKIKVYIEKNLLAIVIGTHIFLFVGAYIGLIPFFKGCYYRGLYYATCGMMDTPTKGIKGFFETIRPQFFWPYGGHLMETYGLSFITYPMIAMGMNSVDATKWGFFICYLLSYLALFILLYKLCRNKYIALAFLVLFYLHPVFRVETRMEPPVYLGILAMPVSMLADSFLIKIFHEDKVSRADSFCYIVLTSIVRLFLVSFSWYIAIIGASFSCGFFLLRIVLSGKKHILKSLKIYCIYILIPWILALMCLLFMTPKETSTFTETSEFMNGSSIDILTLFFPSKDQKISDYVPYFSSENPENNKESNYDFSVNLVEEGMYRPGNGNAWYLGYVILLTALICVLSKKIRNTEMIALLILALGFILLSLGPGLKIGITLPQEMMAQYGRYNLPLEYDYFLFPWRFIFNHLPFSVMRAVSRWIYGAILALYLSSAYCMGVIKKRKNGTWLVTFILMLAFVECLPNQIKHTQYYEETLNQLIDDIALEIEPIVNQEGNRLVICSYDYNSNAYAVPLMMSYLDHCVTYSGAGDKSRDIAEKNQPSVVLECQRTADIDIIVEKINEIDRQSLAEYVLMPHFDVSRAVYIWPAGEDVVSYTEQIASDVVDKLQGKYQVFETNHYTILKLK